MKQQLALRSFTASTTRTYLNATANFLRWLSAEDLELSRDAVLGFLLHVANDRKVAPGTQHAYLMSLRFFARNTLDKPELVAGIPQPRVRTHPPIVPSRAQVRALILATSRLKYRLMLMFAYGAGLRVSEICSLEVSDIDPERGVVHVRQGKGRRPRLVMLSRRLAATVQEHLKTLDGTSPHLFPGASPGTHTQPRALQTQVSKAGRSAGLGPKFRCHSLRHAFATHLMESGVDLVTIQTLLGHNSIRATIRYLHVCTDRIERTPSPLDGLALP